MPDEHAISAAELLSAALQATPPNTHTTRHTVQTQASGETRKLLTHCLRYLKAKQTAQSKQARLYRKRHRWLERPLAKNVLNASRPKQLAIVASLF